MAVTGPIALDPTSPSTSDDPMGGSAEEIRDLKQALKDFTEVSHQAWSSTKAGQMKVGTARIINDLDANIQNIATYPIADYENYVALATDTNRLYTWKSGALIRVGGPDSTIYQSSFAAGRGYVWYADGRLEQWGRQVFTSAFPWSGANPVAAVQLPIDPDVFGTFIAQPVYPFGGLTSLSYDSLRIAESALVTDPVHYTAVLENATTNGGASGSMSLDWQATGTKAIP